MNLDFLLQTKYLWRKIFNDPYGAKLIIVQKRPMKRSLVVPSKIAVKFKKNIWKTYLLNIKL